MDKSPTILRNDRDLILSRIEDFNLLQYEQASMAYREQIGHLIKLVVLFVTIDAGFTGYTLLRQNPIGLVFAGFTGLAAISVVRKMYRLTIPSLCIGVEIETRIENASEVKAVNNPIIRTMVLQELGVNYLSALTDIATTNFRSPSERRKAIRKLKTPWIGPGARFQCFCLGCVSVAQFLLAAGWGRITEHLNLNG